MGQITGGSVSFTRTTRPADFESKSATVTLTFDDEAMLEEAARRAQHTALGMVGIAVPGAAKVDKPATETKADKPKTQTAKDKQKAEAAAKLNAADAAKPAGGDATGFDETPQISKQPEDRKPEAEAAADPDGLDEGPKEITDKDITDAVQRKCAEIGEQGPKQVKELRAKYVEAPKGLRDIPQDKRADFLSKLAALKK